MRARLRHGIRRLVLGDREFVPGVEYELSAAEVREVAERCPGVLLVADHHAPIARDRMMRSPARRERS